MDNTEKLIKERFLKVKEEIINRLTNLPYTGDIEDIAIEIAIICANNFLNDTEEIYGFEKGYFYSGIEHGVNIVTDENEYRVYYKDIPQIVRDQKIDQILNV